MIGAYLVDTITLRQDKGMDKWGEPNTPTDVTVKARVDYKERNIQNAAGQVVVSMAKVMMRPRTIITTGFATRVANTISYKDVIVFDDGTIHAIIMMGKMKDFSVRGIEVYVS